MNINIKKLADISEKKERIIIGLMSGTSLDGLDVAVCKINGTGFDTAITLQHFETVPYDESFKKELREVCFKENVSLQKIALLNKYVAVKHAEVVNDLLQKWDLSSENIDLIASHGQTVYHAPLSLHQNEKYGFATLQIGDGDHLAFNTGIITLSDFRQKNIAGSGEGAPLAVYGDTILFAEKETDVLLINIGGISNFTFIPADLSGEIISSDIGPGNTLMDQWVQLNFHGKAFDENAAIASEGKVNIKLLNALKQDIFFNLTFPKSTGQELFNLNFVEDAINQSSQTINTEDILTTLNKLTADMIIDVIKKYVTGNCKIYFSGGGIHNPLLMRHLKEECNEKLHFTSEKGINADAKEAVLFALLANECVAGDKDFFKNMSEKIPAVSMGKVSFPD